MMPQYATTFATPAARYAVPDRIDTAQLLRQLQEQHRANLGIGTSVAIAAAAAHAAKALRDRLNARPAAELAAPPPPPPLSPRLTTATQTQHPVFGAIRSPPASSNSSIARSSWEPPRSPPSRINFSRRVPSSGSSSSGRSDDGRDVSLPPCRRALTSWRATGLGIDISRATWGWAVSHWEWRVTLGAYGKWRSYTRGRRRAQRKRLEQKRRDQRALRPRSGANATSSPQSQTAAAEVAADASPLVEDQPVSAEHKKEVDALKQQVAAAEAKLAAALAAQDANRQDLEQSLDTIAASEERRRLSEVRRIQGAVERHLHAYEVELVAAQAHAGLPPSREPEPPEEDGYQEEEPVEVSTATEAPPPEPEAPKLVPETEEERELEAFQQELRTQMAHQAECIQRMREAGPHISRAQQIAQQEELNLFEKQIRKKIAMIHGMNKRVQSKRRAELFAKPSMALPRTKEEIAMSLEESRAKGIAEAAAASARATEAAAKVRAAERVATKKAAAEEGAAALRQRVSISHGRPSAAAVVAEARSASAATAATAAKAAAQVATAALSAAAAAGYGSAGEALAQMKMHHPPTPQPFSQPAGPSPVAQAPTPPVPPSARLPVKATPPPDEPPPSLPPSAPQSASPSGPPSGQSSASSSVSPPPPPPPQLHPRVKKTPPPPEPPPPSLPPSAPNSGQSFSMSLPEGEDDLLDADELLGGGDDLLARTDDLLREADELLEGSDELLQSADGPPTPIGSESEFEASFPRPPGSMMKQTPASVQQTPEALKATVQEAVQSATQELMEELRSLRTAIAEKENAVVTPQPPSPPVPQTQEPPAEPPADEPTPSASQAGMITPYGQPQNRDTCLLPSRTPQSTAPGSMPPADEDNAVVQGGVEDEVEDPMKGGSTPPAEPTPPQPVPEPQATPPQPVPEPEPSNTPRTNAPRSTAKVRFSSRFSPASEAVQQSRRGPQTPDAALLDAKPTRRTRKRATRKDATAAQERLYNQPTQARIHERLARPIGPPWLPPGATSVARRNLQRRSLPPRSKRLLAKKARRSAHKAAAVISIPTRLPVGALALGASVVELSSGSQIFSHCAQLLQRQIALAGGGGIGLSVLRVLQCRGHFNEPIVTLLERASSAASTKASAGPRLAFVSGDSLDALSRFVRSGMRLLQQTSDDANGLIFGERLTLAPTADATAAESKAEMAPSLSIWRVVLAVCWPSGGPKATPAFIVDYAVEEMSSQLGFA